MIRSRNALLMVLVLWTGLPLSSAFAHAGLVSSTPASNAHLAELPSQVKLEFGEDLLTFGKARSNVLVVKDPDGVQIDKSDSTISGRFLSVSLDPSSKEGTFSVNWRIVSKDGHPARGSFQFSVTSPPTATPLMSPSLPAATVGTSAEDAAAGKSIGLWRRYQSRVLLGALFIIAIITWVKFKGRNRAGQSEGL